MRTRAQRWIAQALVVFSTLGAGSLAVSQAASQAGQRPGDALLGEWWTENNEGRIRFVRYRDGSYTGITTCCVPNPPTADTPGKDVNNPNPKQRGRSTIGIVLIWHLLYDDGEYSDGYVYNPRDGKTYRFEANVVDRDTVEIRGYIGIPLLGQSQIWKRARSGGAQ